MSGSFTRGVLRSLSFAQVRRISPARRDVADPRVAAIYREMERVFGVISPPVALHWLCREFREAGVESDCGLIHTPG